MAIATTLRLWHEMRVWRRALLREADALLCGGYLDYAEHVGGRPPSWAVLNAVAHADPATLRRLAEEPMSFGPWILDSRNAASALAHHLLMLVGDDEERLELVQRQILVPLELALLADGHELTAADVVVSARSLLGSSLR